MQQLSDDAKALGIWRRAVKALAPPPHLPLADWIEAEIRLPSDLAAVPGPVRLYPFQRGIAEAIGDPALERVTLIKCVRIGFTTVLMLAPTRIRA